MDLSLNDEQLMLADAVRDLFSDSEGDPTAGGESPEVALEFRRDMWTQGAELGLTALPVAEDYDGAGAGIADIWAATHALGTLCARNRSPTPPTSRAGSSPTWVPTSRRPTGSPGSPPVRRSSRSPTPRPVPDGRPTAPPQ